METKGAEHKSVETFWTRASAAVVGLQPCAAGACNNIGLPLLKDFNGDGPTASGMGAARGGNSRV